MNDIVSAEWLKVNIDDPSIVILDASPSGNKSGLKSKHPDVRITNSKSVNLKTLFSDQENPLPNSFPSRDLFQESARNLGIFQDSHLIIYDNLGIYTAPRLWFLFKSMGHKKVSVLNGGLDAWIKVGGETETIENNEIIEGNFSVHENETCILTGEEIFENIENKQWLVVDARSAGRFQGTIPEPREGLRGGHIPNSINIPFKDVLNDGKFRSNDELITIFEPVLSQDLPVAFTCGSGLTACILYLALHLIDNRKKVIYDDSWTGWALDLSKPVIF